MGRMKMGDVCILQPCRSSHRCTGLQGLHFPQPPLHLHEQDVLFDVHQRKVNTGELQSLELTGLADAETVSGLTRC